jgi:glycosyltransferase involved in cell wall biosynthesis
MFLSKFSYNKVRRKVNYNGVMLPIEIKLNSNIQYIDKGFVRLGVFGILRKEKGQQLALRAVHDLLKDGYKLQLHFYGDGPLRDSLEEDVKHNFLQNEVFFHGEVDNAYFHMASNDFILIPSIFESFGYVAVEAMLIEKPIISSNAGGLKEVVDDKFSFVFNSGDLDATKEAIKRAYRIDRKELSHMNRDACRYAENKFSIKPMIDTLMSEYKSIL